MSLSLRSPSVVPLRFGALLMDVGVVSTADAAYRAVTDGTALW